MRLVRIVLTAVVVWACCVQIGSAQHKVDTTRTYDIPEVVVTERYQTRETRASAPLQVLTKDELKSLNALQLSDAVKHFAGVTVKDYGGIGGMKTVSVRSLGAQHTAVACDGLTVTDCQTGQTDIGRFSLENVDRVTLSTGQSDNIFQPARLLASSATLNIVSLTPSFMDNRQTNVKASVKAGSWGLINPAVLIEERLTRIWSVSVNGEWLSSDGRYPYTLEYASDNGLSTKQKRNNTEVKTLRVEASAFGNLSDKEQIRLRAYYYQSSRGLPGATTYYYDYSSQHLWDKNAFAQAQYKNDLSERWAVQASAKWNWSYQHYLDPDYKGSTGKTENHYYQQEYYATASALFRAMRNVSFSLSTDGVINKMSSDLADFAKPMRYSWLTALSGKYVSKRFTATASLLATMIYEDALEGNSAGNHHRLSPFVSVSVKPFETEDLRIRAFYKDAFRLPSFNDLYYGVTRSIDLKPERASQFNVGLTYTKEICSWLPYFSFTADAYWNKVSDKIVATPTKNLFVWSMVNLGKVDIKGLDLTASLSFDLAKGYALNLSGNYTYQRALDVTDSNPETVEGQTYKHQIAYTPRVSGSGQATLETPFVNLSYAVIFSGKRYVLTQNLPKNRLEGYEDHSVSASRDIKFGKTKASVKAEVLNLTGKNYEIIKNFPMPGRSFRITITLDC